MRQYLPLLVLHCSQALPTDSTDDNKKSTGIDIVWVNCHLIPLILDQTVQSYLDPISLTTNQINSVLSYPTNYKRKSNKLKGETNFVTRIEVNFICLIVGRRKSRYPYLNRREDHIDSYGVPLAPPSSGYGAPPVQGDYDYYSAGNCIPMRIHS